MPSLESSRHTKDFSSQTVWNHPGFQHHTFELTLKGRFAKLLSMVYQSAWSFKDQVVK